MKKAAVLVIMILMLLALNSCEKSVYYAQELLELNISPAMGSVSVRVDARTGIKKRGTLKTIITIPHGLDTIIADDPRWKSFPPDQETAPLIYKEFKDLGRFSSSVREGKYILLDHYAADRKNILQRNHYDFIFAVYDSTARTLYYSEVNQ